MSDRRNPRRTVHEVAAIRALQFLLAVNADEAIRRPLRGVGFDRAEYDDRGWRLLRAVAGRRSGELKSRG
jgi:hypothetical protein